MMYRSFAIATLVAAPVIVMAVQNFLPAGAARSKAKNDPVLARQALGLPDQPATPAPAPLVAPNAAPAVPAPSPPSADFAPPMPAAGEPLPGAGQPMLSPGQGLPQPPPSTNGGANPYSTPQQAPPGSPNAEF